MSAVTDEQILARLVQSEDGRKVADAIKREAQAERIRLQCHVTELEKERSAATAELSADVKITASKLEAARQTMTRAEQEHRQAQHKLASTSAGYDGRISQAEAKFLATAPQVIDETLKWLADQADEVRATEIQRRANKTGKFHAVSGEAICDWFSTAETARDRICAIKQSIDECHRLKALILDDAELQQRLDEIKDSLPPVRMTFEGRR
jgi:hypothetical protein